MSVSVQVSPLDAMFPGGVFPSACPSRVVLDHVTSKWGVLVLVALTGRTLRWSELRRRVEGVSEKMLAQTLKTFERDGLIARVARPVIPPHVEYSLTERGDQLVALLHPLLMWMTAEAPAILRDERADLDDEACSSTLSRRARPGPEPELVRSLLH
jgi:DNA-binding HxlR family transcriptional regulator